MLPHTRATFNFPQAKPSVYCTIPPSTEKRWESVESNFPKLTFRLLVFGWRLLRPPSKWNSNKFLQTIGTSSPDALIFLQTVVRKLSTFLKPFTNKIGHTHSGVCIVLLKISPLPLLTWWVPARRPVRPPAPCAPGASCWSSHISAS